MEHYELLREIDRLADLMGLEYAEEFKANDEIVYEVYRTDTEEVIFEAPDLQNLLGFLKAEHNG